MEVKNTSDIGKVFYVVLGAIVDNGGEYPNGHLYALLMEEFDLDMWQRIVATLLNAGLVTQSNYLLKITTKGKELFVKLDAAIMSAQPKEVV